MRVNMIQLSTSMLLICAFLHTTCLAQDIDYSTRTVTATTPDSLIKAEIWNKPVKQKPVPHVCYYWYYNGSINHNTGNYSGKLLHGTYEVFSNKQKLIAKGSFEQGIMTGTWYRWYPNGNLQFKGAYKEGQLTGDVETYTMDGKRITKTPYRKGVVHGKAESYKPDGSLNTSRSYKNGQLDGKSYFYLRDTTLTKVFKNGKEVIKPVKPAKTDKKKEPKDTAVKASAIKIEAKPKVKKQIKLWPLFKKSEKKSNVKIDSTK